MDHFYYFTLCQQCQSMKFFLVGTFNRKSLLIRARFVLCQSLHSYYLPNHTVNCNQHCIVNGSITRCFVIVWSIVCNCPLLKDININTKCFLVWYDKPVIWKFWDCPPFYSSNFKIFRNILGQNCVKSVQIRSYFWSTFSRIRIEYGKIRTRNNSVFGPFSSSAMYFKCTPKYVITSTYLPEK